MSKGTVVIVMGETQNRVEGPLQGPGPSKTTGPPLDYRQLLPGIKRGF